MPQLEDRNFRRAVMLMVHHDETSSFGLVLNRSMDFAISSLFESLGFEWRGHGDDSVSWGGPVEANSGWMLFGDIDLQESTDEEGEVKSVAPGLNFAGSMDVFRKVAAEPPPRLRFFLGYAGWGPGQLEFEISQGAWLSANATAESVFRVSPETMWDHVVRGLGIDPSTLVSMSGIH